MATGTLAREIIVHETQCLTKPPYMTHTEAAGLSVGFCTAYHGKTTVFLF